MRIAVVSGSWAPSPTSAATTVKNLVDSFLDDPHLVTEVLIITPGHGATSYRGIRIHRWRLGDEIGLRRVLDDYRPHVVHVVDPGAIGSAPLRVTSQLGAPTVLSQHSIGNGPFKERWRGAMAGSGAVALATSRAGLDALHQTGLPARLWTPGVDTDLFSPAMRHPAMTERWAKGGQLVVGHVGSVAGKNVFKRLVEIGSLPGVRLVALRATDERGAAERLRVQVPTAKVLGDVSGVDLAHAIASFDVLLQARKKDLDVHAARRALASGVPVVGHDFGGLPDVVTHRHNGLLGDVRRCIESLREDRALLSDLAGPARASVLGRTWRDAARELIDHHYADVARTNAGRRFASA